MQVVVTSRLLELFRDKSIFSGHVAERWRVGDRLILHEACRLEPFAQMLEGRALPLAMGAFSYSHSELDLNMRIGRYGSIGRHVTWVGPPHPTGWVSSSPVFYDDGLPATAEFRERYGVTAPPWPFDFSLGVVEIGHDVWIGDGATIAPGVSIGHGAIIGARSLVLEDVAPYAIVVGHPAKLLRYRLAEALIPRLLESEWWRYAPNVLQALPMNDPERFLDALEAAREGRPKIIRPVPLTGAEIIAAAMEG